MGRRNAAVEIINDLLAQAGIKPEKPRITGGTHIQIRWVANGNKRMYHTGYSPSDWRIQRRVEADVRRMLREDGIII